MKWFVMTAVVLVSSNVYAADEGDLTSLKAKAAVSSYEKSKSKLDEIYQSKVNGLRETLIKGLESSLKDVMKKGDLKEAMLLKETIDKITKQVMSTELSTKVTSSKYNLVKTESSAKIFKNREYSFQEIPDTLEKTKYVQRLAEENDEWIDMSKFSSDKRYIKLYLAIKTSDIDKKKIEKLKSDEWEESSSSFKTSGQPWTWTIFSRILSDKKIKSPGFVCTFLFLVHSES